MPPQAHEAARPPASYRLIRRALRTWLALSRRNIRVLGVDRLPEAAAILHVCHPADFNDALLLVAAFDRPVTCVVDRTQTAGRESLIESSLGMISTGTDAPAWHAALRRGTGELAGGGILLVFAESGDPTAQKPAALKLACEAWMSAFPEHLPALLPVHRFRPEKRAQEILIHLGEPLRLDADEGPGLLQQHVNAALGEVSNIFALDAVLLSRLVRQLEQDLRDRLQQDWSARPGRKRKAEGFRLSPFAAETLRQVNRSRPEDLVALSELSGAESEARRECALAQLRAEIEIKELSGVQRVLGWAESVAGLPVAFYGVLNHLSVALVLFVCGLLRRDAQPRPGPWVVRGVVLLGCYAGQIALVNHFLGRAAAGYYAVTLPLSGAYLVRYGWLIRKRTRVLVGGIRSAMLQTLADKNRARFFEKLDAILAAGSSRRHSVPGN
jgi:hypothetical protein